MSTWFIIDSDDDDDDDDELQHSESKYLSHVISIFIRW